MVFRGICIFFFLCFASLNAETITGMLVRKHFDAPSVVSNPPFGWFVDLDQASQEHVQSLLNTLDDKEKETLSNLGFDFGIVQLMAYQEEIQSMCRELEGRLVRVKGNIENPPYYFRPIPCYALDLAYNICFEELPCCDQPVMKQITPPVTEFLEIKEGRSSKVIDPRSYGIDMDSLSEEHLELPEDSPEILVTLHGVLKLRLRPGPPDYCSIEGGDVVEYGWDLQMDPGSFAIAMKTPVSFCSYSEKEIMEKSNWYELGLAAGQKYEDFFCENINRKITVEGHLFHAHTAHHHTPMLIAVTDAY